VNNAGIYTTGPLRLLDPAEFDRVNAVAPGHTDTTPGGSEVGSSQRAHDEGELLKPVPMGRVGRPEDVAPAVLYLASDAAGYVTGELHYIDGGLRVY
jgi:NAD(P)-dependent dehydrogenase (short-subunit alcohol dehydrogenase family)